MPVNAPKTPRTILGTLPWDENSREASLESVFHHAVTEAEAALRWYQPRIRNKRLWAQGLRLGAIGCGTFAGLLPMVAQLPSLREAIAPVWASISLALAAAILLLDRFFGFSSGWMRFIHTEMQLKDLLEEFLLDWEVARSQWSGPPTEKQVAEMLKKAQGFLAAVHGEVRRETSAWVQEFQKALGEIERVTKRSPAAAPAPAPRPGGGKKGA
ncbi:MAG: SLATT domain-containing protein [Deferrisomatales bacterium]|nr:SLATT domain-containing protein [Deferrisomatales bacterium]